MTFDGDRAQVDPAQLDEEVLIFPTSSAQQRLWFLDQLLPNSSLYNLAAVVRLQGALDIATLTASFQAIVQRHESLRTTFEIVDGDPMQVISPVSNWQLSRIDLQHLETTEQDTEIQRLATEDAQHPFNLSRGPLMRTTLLQLSATENLLLLSMHHIISDQWSFNVLFQELSTFYATLSQGQTPVLPELPIQYGDFAQWQQDWLQGEVKATLLNYWTQQLSGDLPSLQLPTDRPRPAVQSFRGDTYTFTISDRLTTDLKTLTQREGATLFMTLLATFKTLLHRYSGQEDIIVGSPIANRDRVEIEGLIGFFVNTLVLRTDFSGNPSFRTLLKRVQQVTLGAYEHQELPFEQLVEALHPERNLSQNPLFQVMFVLQNATVPTIDSELLLSALDIPSHTAKFDLTFAVEETADGLSIAIEYSSDLFDAATIARMAGHYQTLLAGIVAQPEQPLSQLPLLTETEQQQFSAWNQHDQQYPAQVCLHQWFEQQVARSPDAIAVSFEHQHLTYQDLNQRANQLGHYLQKLGVQPETLVGICVDRSLDMIIGILGILKAGGAYVPLDPTYPAARLAFILEDAQVSVLLTQTSLLSRISAPKAYTICLDQEPAIAQASQDNPTSGATPDNLAYIIYTSGSTGKPKGVLINHANVARLFQATQAWFHFTERDVWTFFHSYAFDFSVWELWGALLYGGRVVVVPYHISRSPDTFYDLLCTEQVTVLNQTPSAFRQLMRVEASLDVLKPLALRLVIFGGEALEIQSLKPWFDRHGDQQPQLVNMYGITETTVHVTYRPLAIADLTGASGSVIGQPIPDLQLYILDQQQQPVPIGVPGEMYIGGAGLARGYLNRPDLTHERFIAHPFSSNSAARLYKSGDLARRLANGDIEYLGRIDHQVKIRGFRIELGEIESALSQHPDIREAVVLVREDIPGNQRLVAYLATDLLPDRVPVQSQCLVELPDFCLLEVTTVDLSLDGVCLAGIPITAVIGQRIHLRLQLPHLAEQWLDGAIAWQQANQIGVEFDLTPAQQTLMRQTLESLLETQGFLKTLQRTITQNLRAFLQHKLPDYMVPDRFLLLPSLPLTANGKVDRRALPAPDQSRLATKDAIALPRTATEEKLLALWSKTLDIAELSIYDNFFELGGNSLLAAQLVLAARERLQVKLPVRCLFEQPTIAGLAAAIEALRHADLSHVTAAVDLPAEAVLPPEISPPTPVTSAAELRHVLLTGATGFLGAFLLHELLQQTQANVYCLVRASEPQQGLQRIQQALEKYELWSPNLSHRIIPVLGDLAQPLLGLAPETFAQLAHQIEAIYHNGADVNFLKPYSQLKAANVLGTQAILQLACQSRTKFVHYVSTVAIFGARSDVAATVIAEDTNIDGYEASLSLGYAQSKWVAEKLIWIAKSRGLPVTVFRAGAIAGSSQTGITNTQDFESSFTKGCIQMGYFPDLGNEQQAFVPVDFASQAIVHLSQQPEAIGQAFHLVNPQPISSVEFFELLYSKGYPLTKLPYEQWREHLMQSLATTPDSASDNALAPFITLYQEEVDQEPSNPSESDLRASGFDCHHVLHGLRNSAIACPSVNQLVDIYLSYFSRSGFLASPQFH
ncbi:MAG: amino acid adenylation domain-containing protein [Trichocoleus desertorum ATA4-8-CV12]|jgi:amino acid adenylation domain-containing protein/thioester reductase-like protein|nr:amino acid adenylation domain-containing protein [Trichocoleus desertorum ATA4-8-CV12]